jgi:hypothetical protein
MEWRAGIMANSARDPYWQGSVRREVLDHPESSAAIQTDCASCHMPLQYAQDKPKTAETEVFKRLPLRRITPEAPLRPTVSRARSAIRFNPAGLGTPATTTATSPWPRPECIRGPSSVPYAADPDRVTRARPGLRLHARPGRPHPRCRSCAAVATPSTPLTLGPDGKQIGQLPEQMTYLEWQHSDYRDKQTCQQCHMPVVGSGGCRIPPRPAARRRSPPQLRRRQLSSWKPCLARIATSSPSPRSRPSWPPLLRAPRHFPSVAVRARHSRPAHTSLAGSELSFPVRVENLTGHKLPTAFPSRRAWLHVVVTAADGHVVFESGKLNPDGSIAGNANDADPPAIRRTSPASQRPIRSRSSSPFSATAKATSPPACSPLRNTSRTTASSRRL